MQKRDLVAAWVVVLSGAIVLGSAMLHNDGCSRERRNPFIMVDLANYIVNY